MRTGGLPCRIDGCLRAFQVVDQKSMDSLRAASAARNDHEITDHGYHHVQLADEPRFTSMRVRPKPVGGA